MSGGCEVPGGTSSSASPWLWQLRHTTVRSRTPPYGDRSQAPEPKRGKSAGSTKPYGDRRDFTQGCGLHSSSRCSRRGVCGAALRGGSFGACTDGADPRCSRAADGGQRAGVLPSLGLAGCRAGYRRAHDLLVVILSFTRGSV